MTLPALSPKQIQSIAECRHSRIAAWSGAVRSGKTIASLIAFILAIKDAPHSGLIIVAGRTLQTIERNLIEPLQDPALFGAAAREVQHTRGSGTAIILGRTVHLIGANDARSEGKLRGLTACLALVDEATLVPEAFFTQLLARLSVAGARLLLTTNPDGPSHWLRKKFLLRAAELDLAHWHFTLDDNHSLSADYVKAIKAEFVGLWRKRMVEGLWVQAEGAVFDMFDEEEHVVDELPRIQKWISTGVDYGSRNPTAVIVCGLGVDGRLYLTHEWRHDPAIAHRQLTDAALSREIRAWMADLPLQGGLRGLQTDWTCVDPSAASLRLQLFEDGITPALADNSVLDGIRLMASLLATDRLKIHRSCKGLLEELPGYSWDDDAAEKGEDKPIKVDDHSIDAARYSIKTPEVLWRPFIRAAA